MHFKISSAKRQSFCLVFNVLIIRFTAQILDLLDKYPASYLERPVHGEVRATRHIFPWTNVCCYKQDIGRLSYWVFVILPCSSKPPALDMTARVTGSTRVMRALTKHSEGNETQILSWLAEIEWNFIRNFQLIFMLVVEKTLVKLPAGDCYWTALVRLVQVMACCRQARPPLKSPNVDRHSTRQIFVYAKGFRRGDLRVWSL